MLKKIAFYLPQFHSIPENDRWWGDGFTEWTNVKNSKPQFRGHIQPEQPLNDNYYNLLEEDVQEWQSQLALDYGIDGFCYYHYWFEGKLLLEKPMENMLTNSNIKIPFCICWANETWSRTWDGQESEILIKQNYSESETAWKLHFDYLLPFFKDERYIKHNGCPMLIIYKPHLISNCQNMIAYWKELAKENGFSDLYVGYQHCSSSDYDLKTLGLDFGIAFEPFYSVFEIIKETSTLQGKINYLFKNPHNILYYLQHKLLNIPKKYNYDEIWNRINCRKLNENVYPGMFMSWDNTPRRGAHANIFYKSSPEKFHMYGSQLLGEYVKKNSNGYIFINAWNEWAEGAHLEPDVVNGYKYLEAIKDV